MSQAFSQQRLIDYFAIINFEMTDYIEKMENSALNDEELEKKQLPNQHNIIYYYPKIEYKEYSLDLKSIFIFLPQEEYKYSRENNKFFSLVYTSTSGEYYYGHFLRVYEEYKFENNKNEKKIFVPKYLCFISMNPFFVSFKSILEEIYSLSKENSQQLVKIENVLNFILFRAVLPRYEDTQIAFSIKNKFFRFNSHILYSEISLKILFKILSVENIVKVFLYLLTSPMVIILHNNIELISPIICAILSLIMPFPKAYSVAINITESLIDMLECPINFIVGVYRKDFRKEDLISNKIKDKKNPISYIVIDLDRNEVQCSSVDIEYEQIKGFEDSLKKKISEHTNIFEPNHDERKNIKLWEDFQNPQINDLLDKSDNPQNSSRKKGSIVSKFEETKIRSIFLEFIATLFIAFDENKHYKNENMNLVYNCEQFLKDSNPEYVPFLTVVTSTPYFDIFIQNITYIVNSKFRSKISENMAKENNKNKTAAILNRSDRIYEFFVKAIEKRRNNKSLYSLFDMIINHTITLPAIESEILNYNQQNIFDNQINESKFTHLSSIKFDNNQFKILIALSEENQFSSSITNFKSKETLSNYSICQNKNLCELFRNFYSKKGSENTYSHFGFKTSKNDIKTDKKLSLQNPRESNPLRLEKVISSKENYINLVKNVLGSNAITPDNKTFTNEFLINIGINILMTASFCDWCHSLNSMWDIRRNIKYNKSKKESKVVCENCERKFVAKFRVSEEFTDESRNLMDENKSRINNKVKKIDKIDYMSIDHIYDSINNLYKDKGTTMVNNYELKKSYYNLYYNLILIFGDFKVITTNNNDKIETLNIEEYIKYQDSKNQRFYNNWKNSKPEKKEVILKKINLTHHQKKKSVEKKKVVDKNFMKINLKTLQSDYNFNKYMKERESQILKNSISTEKNENLNSIESKEYSRRKSTDSGNLFNYPIFKRMVESKESFVSSQSKTFGNQNLRYSHNNQYDHETNENKDFSIPLTSNNHQSKIIGERKKSNESLHQIKEKDKYTDLYYKKRYTQDTLNLN